MRLVEWRGVIRASGSLGLVWIHRVSDPDWSLSWGSPHFYTVVAPPLGLFCLLDETFYPTLLGLAPGFPTRGYRVVFLLSVPACAHSVAIHPRVYVRRRRRSPLDFSIFMASEVWFLRLVEIRQCEFRMRTFPTLISSPLSPDLYLGSGVGRRSSLLPGSRLPILRLVARPLLSVSSESFFMASCPLVFVLLAVFGFPVVSRHMGDDDSLFALARPYRAGSWIFGASVSGRVGSARDFYVGQNAPLRGQVSATLFDCLPARASILSPLSPSGDWIFIFFPEYRKEQLHPGATRTPLSR